MTERMEDTILNNLKDRLAVNSDYQYLLESYQNIKTYHLYYPHFLMPIEYLHSLNDLASIDSNSCTFRELFYNILIRSFRINIYKQSYLIYSFPLDSITIFRYHPSNESRSQLKYFLEFVYKASRYAHKSGLINLSDIGIHFLALAKPARFSELNFYNVERSGHHVHFYRIEISNQKLITKLFSQYILSFFKHPKHPLSTILYFDEDNGDLIIEKFQPKIMIQHNEMVFLLNPLSGKIIKYPDLVKNVGFMDGSISFCIVRNIYKINDKIKRSKKLFLQLSVEDSDESSLVGLIFYIALLRTIVELNKSSIRKYKFEIDMSTFVKIFRRNIRAIDRILLMASKTDKNLLELDRYWESIVFKNYKNTLTILEMFLPMSYICINREKIIFLPPLLINMLIYLFSFDILEFLHQDNIESKKALLNLISTYIKFIKHKISYPKITSSIYKTINILNRYKKFERKNDAFYEYVQENVLSMTTKENIRKVNDHLIRIHEYWQKSL